MEHFVILEDYPNYAISRRGEVKNIKTGNILKPSLSHGYQFVVLYKNTIRSVHKIHKLMAMAYLGHQPNGTQRVVVDHINNDKLNNRIENLQLISHRKNTSKDTVKKDNLPTGVQKSNKRYRARIRIGIEQKNLGTFDTPEEASAAYQLALSKLDI